MSLTVDGTMELDPTDTFRIRPDLVVESIEDDVVIFDLKSDTYFSLNSVAREVWQGIGEGKTIDQVVDAVARKYDGATREEIRADAAEFVKEAVEAGLIERSS